MDTKLEIEIRCYRKAQELLGKHFPNFIEEAAVTRPETLSESYDNDLPAKVAEEFRSWLANLWEEVKKEGQKSFDEVMNLQRSIEMTDSSYFPYLNEAREKAEKVSFWEKLTKSNHEDVTHYKGILKDYTEELLKVMIADFMSDVIE